LSKILTAIRLSGPFWIEDSIGFEADCMSSNLLRPVFARTFRDYPISMACVKQSLNFSDSHATFAHDPAFSCVEDPEGAKL
jgi:hypothetical protein